MSLINSSLCFRQANDTDVEKPNLPVPQMFTVQSLKTPFGAWQCPDWVSEMGQVAE